LPRLTYAAKAAGAQIASKSQLTNPSRRKRNSFHLSVHNPCLANALE
jgi:hypothetical protein